MVSKKMSVKFSMMFLCTLTKGEKEDILFVFGGIKRARTGGAAITEVWVKKLLIVFAEALRYNENRL